MLSKIYKWTCYLLKYSISDTVERYLFLKEKELWPMKAVYSRKKKAMEININIFKFQYVNLLLIRYFPLVFFSANIILSKFVQYCE